MASQIVTLTVNGATKELIAQPSTTLLMALREPLHLTAAKRGCAQGACGSCTVIVDGEPVVSCMIPVVTVDGAHVETLEGRASDGELDHVQQAFLDGFATQCGFCTAGMIMSAEALLARNPNPDAADVREAISGNVCRCTGYEPIVRAVLDAASRRREDTSAGDTPDRAGRADALAGGES